MSLESQIGSLVEAANNLTGEVSGKMKELDRKADSLIQTHAADADPHEQYLTEARAKSKLQIYTPDPLRQSVEAASGGRVTVFYTDKGQPSYFHVLPKFLCEDIAPGGELGTGVFPAFLNNGVEETEIYIGQFLMSDIAGEGVSQPMRDPRRSINYDDSRALAQACGQGFDLSSVWDWAALHYWAQVNGFEPRGNTNHGRHHDERHETGRRQDGGVPGDSSGVGNTLTGSGPMAWRHDGTPAGVADTVGNLWEWQTGMKLVDGRIFLASDNGIGSEDGYIDTGFDMPSSVQFNDADGAGAPVNVLQAMLLPTGNHPMSGRIYTSLEGERLPRRGGHRSHAGRAGPSALNLRHSRTHAGTYVGARPRFRKP